MLASLRDPVPPAPRPRGTLRDGDARRAREPRAQRGPRRSSDGLCADGEPGRGVRPSFVRWELRHLQHRGNPGTAVQGLTDNTVSSIKVGANVVAVVHQDADFGGLDNHSWQTIAQSDANLGDNLYPKLQSPPEKAGAASRTRCRRSG